MPRTATKKTTRKFVPYRRAPRKRPYVSVRRTRKGTTVRGYGGYSYQNGLAAGAALARTAYGGPKISYGLNKNSLMLGLDPPIVKNIKKGEGVTICHREYITDIMSGTPSTAFTLMSYDLQPGLQSSFPWLSQIAANFQEYEWNGIVFEYKSLSADAVVGTNNSGALGDVIMATEYNAANPNYSNKVQMLESEYSTDGKPSESMIHPIECLRSLTPVSRLYVRSGVVPVGQDQRLFDLGNFQIANQGSQANGVLLGELWASYEVTFYKPILGGNASGLDILTDKFQITTPSATNPFGASRVAVNGSTLGCTLSTTTITFPTWVTQGTWFIHYWIVGQNSATIQYPVVIASAGVSLLNVWPTSTAFDTVPMTTTGSGLVDLEMEQSIIISISPAGTLPATITFTTGSGVFPSGNVKGDLIITQLNTNIIN